MFKFIPKLVLFDLDGTLVDTMQAYADVAADLISARHGLNREIARSRYLETSGLPFVKQIDLIVGAGLKNAETEHLFEKQKLEATSDVRLPEDNREALQMLNNRGYLLAISSSNLQKNINEFVRREALGSIIHRALGWGIEGRGRKLLRALGFNLGEIGKGDFHFDDFERVLKVPRKQMLFVGDSLKDAEIALNGGLYFIAKLGTFNKEDFVSKFPKITGTVNHVKELLNLLS